MDLIYDRRTYDADGNTIYDPLSIFLELFDGVESKSTKVTRATELAARDRCARKPSRGWRQTRRARDQEARPRSRAHRRHHARAEREGRGRALAPRDDREECREGGGFV